MKKTHACNLPTFVARKSIQFVNNRIPKLFKMTTLANPLSIMGERSVGRDVRTQNVMAASSIANIVKSSLGPVVRISNLKIRTLQLKMSEILKKNYLKNPEKKNRETLVTFKLHSADFHSI